MDHAVIKNFGILFLHYNRDIKGHLYMKSNFFYKLQLKAKQDELRRKLHEKGFFPFSFCPIFYSFTYTLVNKISVKCQTISA